MMLLLVAADEDAVPDVIHRFDEIGLTCLDPRWAGGRPHLLNADDEDFVVATAKTRPTKLGQPFTHWSIRKLAAYLRTVHGRVIRIGREALRCLLARRSVTFQRTKTWKESTDPAYDVKLDRIEHVVEHFSDRVFAFDEFGPLGIRPKDGLAGQSGADPTGSRRPTTASTESPTSTAATRSATTPCGVSIAVHHPNHTVQTRELHAYLRWRNAHVRHPDVLAAERRERARIRSEKGLRWGGSALTSAA